MVHDEREPLPASSNGYSQEEIAEQIKNLRRKLNDLERLFAPAVREKVPQGKLVILVTRVGRERIAFLQHTINEIVPMARMTPVPDSAPWIAGILNLRGKPIAVIDVLSRIQNKWRRPELDDFIVVCHLEGRTVGLIVQELLEIREVEGDDLHDTPADIPFAVHVIGTLLTDGWPVLLLSLNTLVATSDLPNDGFSKGIDNG